MVRANDQDEKARLEFERLRVEIERRRLMLEERRSDLATFFAAAEHSREFANQYAKAALQSLFLLNGGALIAFPAFGQLVGAAFKEQVAWVVASVAGFVLGLVCVVLATLMAFLALDAVARSELHSYYASNLQHQKTQFPEIYDEADEAKLVEVREISGRHQAHFGRFRLTAILLGLCSLIAFIFGALCAASVLGTNAP